MLLAFLLRTKQTILSRLSTRGFDRSAFEEQAPIGTINSSCSSEVGAPAIEFENWKVLGSNPARCCFLLPLLSSKKLN